MSKIATSYRNGSKWLKNVWNSPHAKYIFPFLLLLCSFVGAVIQSHGDLGSRLLGSFQWMVKYGSPLCLVAIGASLVLASGGVDISSSGVATMGGVIMAISLNLLPIHFNVLNFQISVGFIIGLLCVILFGYMSGRVLGFSITKSNSPPLIYSWALGIVWFALAIVISASVKGINPFYKEKTTKTAVVAKLNNSAQALPDSSNHNSITSPIINRSALDTTKITGTVADSGGVSVDGLELSDSKAFYLLIILLAFSQILWYTGLPRKACAVGANKDSAIYAGISVKKTTISCYIWSSIFSSLAGVLTLYQTSKASTSGLAGKEIVAIAVAVIGGTVMSGGYLNIFSVIAAAFFYSNFKRITTDMNFSNMPQQQQMIDTIFALTFILLIMVFGKKINGITQSIQVERNTKQE